MEDNTLTVQQLHDCLGMIFTTNRSSQIPEVYQIVGWTKGATAENKKRRYVKVRLLNHLIKNSDPCSFGGDWRITVEDLNSSIKQVKAMNPLKSNHEKTVILFHYKPYDSYNFKIKNDFYSNIDPTKDLTGSW